VIVIIPGCLVKKDASHIEPFARIIPSLGLKKFHQCHQWVIPLWFLPKPCLEKFRVSTFEP
ncbi:MAG: hypothetical protein WAU47_02825, partial [Desulfobaccales bacterium]